MADHFVDSANGNDGNSGHDMDNAWATIEYALESGALIGGDIVWVRRNVNEIPTTDIACAYDGDPEAPIYIIGCPRAVIPNTTITQADWTNGSATVDNIVGITCDREKHQARYVTAPDGEQYMITRVVDTNTVMIDNEYVGTTVTTTAGAFQIEADEDYTLFNAIVDTTWTIKVSDWTGDADDVPHIDFNGGNYCFVIGSSDYYHRFKNLEFRESTDYYGVVYANGSGVTSFEGCLFYQDISDATIECATQLASLKRCTIEGSGSGSTQTGFYILSGMTYLIDVAIYNMGDYGVHVSAGLLYLENVNIGVEIANGDADIAVRSNGGACVYGRDVKLGGTNGDVETSGSYEAPYDVTIENFGKVLGAHKSFYSGGTWERAAVSGETPNKKVSDNVIKISPNIDRQYKNLAAQIIFTEEFEATAVEKAYKYWLYNDTGDTLNSSDAKGSIWLELEYISEYDDTSEYVIKKEYSTEIDIADAADADDWDYLQITGITPATASKVRLKCYCRHYTAAGDIFIDENINCAL